MRSSDIPKTRTARTKNKEKVQKQTSCDIIHIVHNSDKEKEELHGLYQESVT